MNSANRKIASVLMHEVMENFNVQLMVGMPRFNGGGFRSFRYVGDQNTLIALESFLLMEMGILCAVTADGAQLDVPSVWIENAWMSAPVEAGAGKIRVNVDLESWSTQIQQGMLNA